MRQHVLRAARVQADKEVGTAREIYGLAGRRLDRMEAVRTVQSLPEQQRTP